MHKIKYCKLCGLLIIGRSCRNEKCKKHIEGTESATFKQTEYIQVLAEKLGEEYDTRAMTKNAAGELIEELLERVEIGGDDQ